MISTRWLEKRKPHWSRLEALLERATNRGFKSLSRFELQELGLLYRQIAADLAVLREDRGSVHFARYLNQLLACAHNTIYSAHRASPSAVVEYFRFAYPRIFRQNLSYCLAAFFIFLGSAIVGMALTYHDPDFKVKILGPQMVETIERHQMWTHSIVGIKPVASSAIMTNNLGVAFMSFAAGITAGIGTIYMMIFNGLLIGVIGTACRLSGMSLQLWSFVAPHGVLELPAIFISGGAGLRLAYGLLFPGFLPRRESINNALQVGPDLLTNARYRTQLMSNKCSCQSYNDTLNEFRLYVNQSAIPYGAFTNSNSVTSSAIQVLGLPEPDLPWNIWLLSPGWDTSLLPESRW